MHTFFVINSAQQTTETYWARSNFLENKCQNCPQDCRKKRFVLYREKTIIKFNSEYPHPKCNQLEMDYKFGCNKEIRCFKQNMF